LQHTQNAYTGYPAFGICIGPSGGYQLAIHPAGKRPPVQKKTNRKDQQTALKHFFPESGRSSRFQPRHHKSHGVADGKQKKREYQVGGSDAMPGCMCQRTVNVAPASGVVH
jgi:hypothetical protein